MIKAVELLSVVGYHMTDLYRIHSLIHSFSRCLLSFYYVLVINDVTVLVMG